MIQRYTPPLLGMVTAIAILISISLASADTTATIDFEGLTDGSFVSTLSCNSGINCSAGDVIGSVSVFGSNPAINSGNTNVAVPFNAECLPGTCTGDDDDLSFPGHGKILIINEDQDPFDPDDGDVVGSLFEFDFSNIGPGEVTVNSIDVGDIEIPEGAAFLEGFSGGCTGTSLGITDLPQTGDQIFETVPVSLSGVDCLRVHLNGSGAIDNLSFTAVDQPGEPGDSGIDIEKWTNGKDADGANDPDVPQIAEGNLITWKYTVTNSGDVPLMDVTVFDDNGTPDNASDDFPPVLVSGDNGDNILAVDEIWIFLGSTLAIDLGNAPTGVNIVNGCNPLGLPNRPAYQNLGVVTASGGARDEDKSHYCNPTGASINIEKSTNGVDADLPTGPVVPVGSAVNFSYVVTNTGTVELSDVSVSDDQNVLVNCPATGLAPGAAMTCTGETIAVAGQYTNLGTACGLTTDGQTVCDDDPSNHFGAETTTPAIDIEKWTRIGRAASGGNLCEAFGKPQTLNMVYTGDNILKHPQGRDKVNVTGDAGSAPLVRIISADKVDATGKVYFDGNVNLGRQFVIDAALAGDDELRSKTFVLIFHQDGHLLQTIEFHTSCSQPLELGNHFGGVQLIGYTDEDGNGDTLDPTFDFGEDADVPTGPVGQVGDDLTWTYLVINTGGAPLADVFVLDDNGTSGDNKDDFSPTFVDGDNNFDGLLDPGETWRYQATGKVEPGLYSNIGNVTGVAPDGTTVIDADPSHYLGKVKTIDVCDTLGKPQTLTMVYTGENILDHSQDRGKVKVTGDPEFASPVSIVSAEKKDGTGKIYFEGKVNLGQEFVIDAKLARDDKLRSKTFVLIFDQDGDQLQTIEFHTSCSQPLELGNQFGGVQLMGVTDKHSSGGELGRSNGQSGEVLVR